jgi:hypothetical protein
MTSIPQTERRPAYDRTVRRQRPSLPSPRLLAGRIETLRQNATGEQIAGVERLQREYALLMAEPVRGAMWWSRLAALEFGVQRAEASNA